MALPGFTATVSLSPSTNHYGTSPLITRAFFANSTAYRAGAALAFSGSGCSCTPPPNGCCQGDSQGFPCFCCRHGNRVSCIFE